MVLAAGLGRSQILGDRVLCVQAVCSKVVRALSWEGGMSSCLCVCMSMCVRERDKDRGREEGEIPFLLPGPLPGQNEVPWFSSRRTITWRACGRGGTHRPGRENLTFESSKSPPGLFHLQGVLGQVSQQLGQTTATGGPGAVTTGTSSKVGAQIPRPLSGPPAARTLIKAHQNSPSSLKTWGNQGLGTCFRTSADFSATQK